MICPDFVPVRYENPGDVIERGTVLCNVKAEQDPEHFSHLHYAHVLFVSRVWRFIIPDRMIQLAQAST